MLQLVTVTAAVVVFSDITALCPEHRILLALGSACDTRSLLSFQAQKMLRVGGPIYRTPFLLIILHHLVQVGGHLINNFLQ